MQNKLPKCGIQFSTHVIGITVFLIVTYRVTSNMTTVRVLLVGAGEINFGVSITIPRIWSLILWTQVPWRDLGTMSVFPNYVLLKSTWAFHGVSTPWEVSVLSLLIILIYLAFEPRKLGRRLKIIAIIDPDTDRARSSVYTKLSSSVSHAYEDTQIFSTVSMAAKSISVSDHPQSVIAFRLDDV